MILTEINDAGTRLPELVRAAENGEDIVLARNGTPSVRLVAIPSFSSSRDLTPDPTLRPVLAAGYDPAEPLSMEEWPSCLQ